MPHLNLPTRFTIHMQLPFSKASGQLTFPGLIPIRKRALIGRGTHRGIPLVFWNRFSLLDDDYGQREFEWNEKVHRSIHTYVAA